MALLVFLADYWLLTFVGMLAFVWWLKGWRNIGANEQGLVERNWGGKSLASGKLIALEGERGYQCKTLAPGWQWVPWLIYTVTPEPIVQVASDELALIVAQVGQPLPVGVRTAEYKSAFGDYENLEAFLQHGGMKGRQRWVLRPGTYRIHPIAFLVLTPRAIYGLPLDPQLAAKDKRALTLADFHLRPEQLRPTVVRPKPVDRGVVESEMADDEQADPRYRPVSDGSRDQTIDRHTRLVNQMGIITSHEGLPLEDGGPGCSDQE